MVRDLAYVPNIIATNSKAAFVVSPYSSQDIGGALPAGLVAAVGGGFDISAGGGDIGGTTDQFNFNFQIVTGNFDQQMRTPITISEIMYKPAKRSDGRNTEFVELFNSNPWSEDMSGYRLDGEIQFTFPAHTMIPGGGFIVLAAASADLQYAAGLSGVLGPYSGSLKASGELTLYDEAGALLLDVNYADTAPWPMGADGTGHSIVLARPSYGEADPHAWDLSDVAGGSPGTSESFRPSPLRLVMLNEILAHTDPPAPCGRQCVTFVHR